MFKGIEGARAWLAWTVVASHIALFTDFPSHLGAASKIVDAGHHAVGVFIIISGFVITHLILSRQEPYGQYIARRFLRIYPAYLACLLIGVVVSPIFYEAARTFPYASPSLVRHISAQAAETSAHFWPHFIAHLTLLHGAIPNNVLNESQYMFLGPAWSLSLEWQFYLVAPLVVAAVQGRHRLPLVLAAALGYFAYNRGVFGEFYNPSILPGAGLLFLLGIGTRLAVDHLPKFRAYPFALVAGLGSVALFSDELIPVAAWIALVGYFQSRTGAPFLDGKVANWAGARSYSVYILHQPVIYLSTIFAFNTLGLQFWPALALVTAMVLAGTTAAAEILYRTVERPMIQMGKRLGRPRALKAA